MALSNGTNRSGETLMFATAGEHNARWRTDHYDLVGGFRIRASGGKTAIEIGLALLASWGALVLEGAEASLSVG
jgi:hypothetical protein